MKRYTYITTLAAMICCGTAIASADVIPAEQALQRAIPAQETFTTRMTYGGDYGRTFGMAAVALNSAKDVTLNMQSADKVKLYYEGELMQEIGVAGSDYSGITNIGVQLTDDGSGLLEFEAQNTWLLMFNAMAPSKYKNVGEYLVEIPEGLFVKGDDVVAGITLRYNLVSQMPETTEPTEPVVPPGGGDDVFSIPFEHVFVPGSPTRNEFSLSTSYWAEYGMPYGVAAIALNCPKGVELVEDCKEKVQLYRGATLVGEVGLDDSGTKGIRNIGISLLEEGDGLIDFNNGTTTYLFMFDSTRGKDFQEAGKYTFKMPAGLFRYEDALIDAGEMNFNYLGDAPTEYTFSITPEEGTIFSVDNPIRSLSITFDGYINMIDYEGTPGALYGPDGKALSFETRYPSTRGTTISWDFKENKKNPIDWKPGEYTFRLPARSVSINAWAEYIDGVFPEKELTVMYVLTADLAGVSVIGGEPAPSYTIYTLDGACVATEADRDIFATLPAGLYIVNGRKVIIK